MPSRRRPIARAAAVLCCWAALSLPSRAQDLDYGGYFDRGKTFAEFLTGARSQKKEWRAHYNDAAVSADVVTRVRALRERRRILVVAEDWCSDSVNTIPYVARLVDAAPDRLQMRIVSSNTGRPIMEAHRTPEGRAATPTIIVLSEDGRVLGEWTERPAALRLLLENQKRSAKRPPSKRTVHDRAMKWYADDHGTQTVADIVQILAR